MGYVFIRESFRNDICCVQNEKYTNKTWMLKYEYLKIKLTNKVGVGL